NGEVGTPIGDMTGQGGLAAAFNGNANQAFSASAATTATDKTGWIGKDFSGAPVKLHYVVVTGSSDFGFDGSSDTTTVTINIRGKNGGVPSSRTDGDLLGSWTGSDAPGLSRLIATGDNSTVPYDYLFVE